MKRGFGAGRLWKRGSAWVLDWSDAEGMRKRRTLSTDKRAAEQIRTEIIHQRDMEIAGLGAVLGQQLLLSEIQEQYLEDLQTRVTPAHYKNVEGQLRKVIEEIGPKRTRDLRAMDLVRVRTAATKAGAANRTANLRVDRVIFMLNWAIEAGVIARNPIQRLRRLPEGRDHQRYKRRAFTDDEIDRFLAASEADDNDCEIIWDYQRVPQTPMWLAFLETAARWNELRLATWGDIDFDRRLLVLRAENTKSRKQRVIPLSKALVVQLKRLRVLHEEVHRRIPNVGDRVLLSPEGMEWKKPTTNVMRIFNRVLDRAGIPKVDSIGEKVDLHAIRHTALTRFARNGATLAQLQAIAGHSDPKLTMQVYTHLNVEDLRSAVEGPNSKAEKVKAKEAR